MTLWYHRVCFLGSVDVWDRSVLAAGVEGLLVLAPGAGFLVAGAVIALDRDA